MPIIRLELLSGRTPEQKSELADVLTRETARIAKCALKDVQIVFAEVASSNWAVGGTMVAIGAAQSNEQNAQSDGSGPRAAVQ